MFSRTELRHDIRFMNGLVHETGDEEPHHPRFGGGAQAAVERNAQLVRFCCRYMYQAPTFAHQTAFLRPRLFLRLW